MTNSKPLSVIFGTYKNPELIIPTLEGLKNQSFKEFVVYVVDDNSPNDLVLIDRAKSIINQYKELDIHFIKNETNIGVPHVFRKWIGLAKTKYFYICGAGDRLVPGAFESMVSFLEENPEASMVHGLDIYGAGIKRQPLFQKTGLIDANVYLKSHLSKLPFRNGYSWSQASAIFRTELFNTWNIPVKHFHYWDYYFHCSYLLHSKKIGYINDHFGIRNDDQKNTGYVKLPDFVSHVERHKQAIEFVDEFKTRLIADKHNVYLYISIIKFNVLLACLFKRLRFQEIMLCSEIMSNKIISHTFSFLISIMFWPLNKVAVKLFNGAKKLKNKRNNEA